MWGLTSLTNYKSLGQTLGCGRGCSYSLAPGDDSGVELHGEREGWGCGD